MIKKIKKRLKIKFLLLQLLYTYSMNNSNSFDLCLFDKLNKSKIGYNLLYVFYINLINKNNLLENLIKSNFNSIIKLDLIELIILKIFIYELFFEKNFNLKIIITDSLYLINKFCDKSCYNKIKKLIFIILNSYVMLKIIK